VQNQKAGKQIAPRRSSFKDLSVYGEVGDLTAVSDAYGKPSLSADDRLSTTSRLSFLSGLSF